MEDLEVMVETGLSVSQQRMLTACKANVPRYAGTATAGRSRAVSPSCSMGEAASGVPCPVPGLRFRRDTRKLEGRDGDGPGAHDLQGE